MVSLLLWLSRYQVSLLSYCNQLRSVLKAVYIFCFFGFYYHLFLVLYIYFKLLGYLKTTWSVLVKTSGYFKLITEWIKGERKSWLKFVESFAVKVLICIYCKKNGNSRTFQRQNSEKKFLNLIVDNTSFRKSRYRKVFKRIPFKVK